MDFNGNSEGDFSGFDTPAPSYNSGSAPSTPSLEGGDASTDIQNRMKQFGLLGLFGDNGNAMNGFGGIQGGTNINDGSTGTGWQTDAQAFGPNGSYNSAQPDYQNASQNVNTALMGWGGDNPNGPEGFDGPLTTQVDASPNKADGTYTAMNPDYAKWLSDQGLTPKTLFGEGGQTSAFFNKDNNQVGSARQWQYDPDTAFGLALATAGAAGGGFMGGQLLGAAGAAGGAAADPAFGSLAGGTSYAGTGAAAGAAGGFGAGLGGSLAANGPTGQALRNAAIGGVTGGFSGGVNLAGDMGVSDPNYSSRINSAIMAGGRAGLTGDNIGQAVLGSGVQSGLGAALQYGSGALNKMGDDDTNDGSGPSISGYSPQSPFMGSGMFGSPSGVPSYGNTDTSGVPSLANGGNTDFGYGGGYDTGAGLNISTPNTSMRQSNPLMDAYKSMMGGSTGMPSKPGNFDSMAGNLLSLYQAHKNASQYGGLASGLQSMYGPNSPYAQQLQQQLMRSDAAAGRRSQVGPRSVELQARLAQLNSQNAPTLAKLFASQQNNQGQELQSLLRLGMNPGVMGGLQNLWNPPNQNGNGYGGSGSDQYGEGYGPQ